MFLNKLFLIFLVSASASWAWACDELVWTVNGKGEGVCYDEKHEAMVSAKCLSASCEAVTFLEKARQLKLSSTRTGTVQNPGSPYCKFLKGTVVIATNERGSQTAFCKASDGSLVELSSLGRKPKAP